MNKARIHKAKKEILYINYSTELQRAFSFFCHNYNNKKSLFKHHQIRDCCLAHRCVHTLKELRHKNSLSQIKLIPGSS